MAEILFEITKDHLETGLRGFPVGYCTTSLVEPQKGLFYVERSITELADWTPEEVIYLLFTGKDRSDSGFSSFIADLKKRSKCNRETIDTIKKLPRKGHPTKLFMAAILVCGMIEGKGDYWEDGLNLVAKMPELAAAVINHHAGWGDSQPSNPDLGYIENFAHMLNVPNGDKEQLAEAFKVFDVLHMDHGGGNLSTFVGKAIASGLEDMYGSITGAMAALAGPKHGRANQDCLEFVQEILNELGENATEQEVEKLIRRRLEENKLIFGFGHAVLRVEDPRSTIFFALAKKKYPDHPLVKIASLLKEAGTKVLSENPKITDPYTNVDSISGTYLAASGFNYPEYFTVLFGLSRTVGIARQIIYERLEARDGKGTPIVRPKYLYKKRD